ncbi:MAG: hypothetical protein IH889_03680 [Planctomycetes bacterium]|nr:hypothetical protein [Planctomycetota bacterium]
MTSAQLMPPGAGRRSVVARVAVALVGWMLLAGGCTTEQLIQPRVLMSPYEHQQLWAVAPFANESGVSTVDTTRFADLFTQQLEQVQGINSIPVNRVIFAMRQLDMRSVASPADAMELIHVLDIDAIVVGTVTAYDPYPPPTLGAAVQLYARLRSDRSSELDPRALTRATTDVVAPGELGPPNPIAEATGVFDAINHQTLAWLEQYAAGRSEPDGSFGNDVYLVSMELYTQFVSYRLIHDLLAWERARLMPVAANASSR